MLIDREIGIIPMTDSDGQIRHHKKRDNRP